MNRLRRPVAAACAVSLCSLALGACSSAPAVHPVQVTLRPSGPVTSAELTSMQSVERARLASLGVAAGSTVRVVGEELVVTAYLGRRPAKDVAVLSETGRMLMRPVECFAAPYVPPLSVAPRPPSALPRCAPQYFLTAANVGVQPNANVLSGYTSNNVVSDPAFSAIRATSTSRERGGSRILAASLPSYGVTRYVLGPALLTGAAVMSAAAQRDSTGAWVVNATLTPAGAVAWDHVSMAMFHRFIGIELDGVVFSAPLVLPAQVGWTSFNGMVSISGNLSASDASRTAIALDDHALAVPVTVVSVRTLAV